MVLSDDGDAFISVVQKQTVPRIEQSTVPFFHLRKNPQTNEYENGVIDKDRSGVLLKIGDDHFLLTAAHNIPDMVRDKIFLCMSWDEDEHAPIPITTDQIAVSDERTLDVAAIKLLPETAEKLLRRHTPLSLADLAIDCRSSDGLFLIVGYPRAGTEFFEQKWNDPYPHEIKTESLKCICKRMLDGWKHDKLQYSPEMHIVVGMSASSVSGTSGQPEVLPDHGGIQGISGCGIWFIADRNRKLPLSAFGVSDCKLVAIEHSYDEAAGRVAGTWIDVALAFLSLNFPETRPAMKLIYPQSPAIWTP